MSKTNPLKYTAVADLMEQHELMATAVEAHGVICGLV
ncbi:MAG: YecA family protein, partial [Aeromonas sp.]|nr:YecA family protein [Aeromonas sp.]